MIPPREAPTTNQQKAIAQRLVGQEALLVDYVQKLERHRRGRRAVFIRLSGLQVANRREHHIRIAINTFEVLVKQLKGQVFSLSSADLIFIFKETALDEVEAAVVKLRFLFSDDPLLADEGFSGKPSFADWFLLERDYEALLQMAQRAADEEQQRRTQEFAKNVTAQQSSKQLGRGDPLTPTVLAKIEQSLARADLANMMRRQAISAIVGKAAPQQVFLELFISIADLRETILPNINLASSPWLFQQLTETLDKRVLSLLNKHDDRTVAGDVSINLNVQTLLAPEFLTFDDNLKAAMRGTIVLELQKVDVFADLGAFLFARDFAHDRGYRICIDGVNIESLPFVDRERLGVDLIKIVWDQSMVNGMLPNGTTLESYVQRCGASRVILCRCDAQDAIETGQSVGITLFQGRHVEALLAAEIQKAKGGLISGRRR
jgi:EAL domain-containing protein (putative c-di-GMP-specific phosphodiesterase class I)